MERESKLRSIPTLRNGDRRGSIRPSLLGGEDLPFEAVWHPDGRFNGLSKVEASRTFKCPECQKDFGKSAQLLGQHIVRHEPFLNPKWLNKPKQCGKCSRWLEICEGQYNFHVNLCMGELPL